MTTGTSFELRVKKLLEDELQKGELGLSPSLCKVHHKKGYWSRDRQKEIIVDLSVEIRRPNEEEPFLIWVWECKDYTHAVPVDDLEEFHAKLEQLPLHKTKGTCVCRDGGFQSGAEIYAKAKGIGLARVLDPGRIIRLTEGVGDTETIEKGLTYKYPGSLKRDFYGLSCGGGGAQSIAQLLRLELSGAS